MKIRFFNTYEPVTTFYRDMLPYLAQKGITSEVLISATEYRQGGRSKLSDTIEDPHIHIRYQTAFGLGASGRVQKAISMLAYILGSIWKTLFGENIEVNFFLTQPPLYNIWGWALKKLRGQPYICLVMDIYPDVAVMDGMLPSSGWITELLSHINRFALRQADAVIVIGRCMAECVTDMGVATEKIHFIPNWANPEIVHPISPSKNHLRQELGLDNKLLVLYSGNMGASHNFDDLLDVIDRCKDESELHFVFVGGGRRRKEIEKFISEKQPHNITLLPYQPLDQLAVSLSLGDVHFISLREGFEGLVVPSKAYGAFAAGRAVIYQGNENGEIARVIQEENVGTVVQPDNVDNLERVIRGYLDNSQMAEKQGQLARQLTVEKLAVNDIVEKYYQVIIESARS